MKMTMGTGEMMNLRFIWQREISAYIGRIKDSSNILSSRNGSLRMIKKGENIL